MVPQYFRTQQKYTKLLNYAKIIIEHWFVIFNQFHLVHTAHESSIPWEYGGQGMPAAQVATSVK